MSIRKKLFDRRCCFKIKISGTSINGYGQHLFMITEPPVISLINLITVDKHENICKTSPECILYFKR